VHAYVIFHNLWQIQKDLGIGDNKFL